MSFPVCPTGGPLSLDAARRRGGRSSLQSPWQATIWGAWKVILNHCNGLDFCTVICALSGFIVSISPLTHFYTVFYNTLQFEKY